ncbi:MAG: sugar phosphate isomerase/epimerase [Lachnospiraceae bacterium]|nr:sugar phosphate isomerase/epimerase [Lachnospiraceae bacterium]
MRIAAFYENIKSASEIEGIPVYDILAELKELGLELIYISGDSYKEDRDFVKETLKKLGLGVEGMHQHFDFAHDANNRTYEEFIDLAKEAGASNILLVPGFVMPDEKDKEEEILKNMKACMTRAVEYGKKAGVDVCMEDFDSMNSPINSVDGLDIFFDSIPDLKCAFDTGNFCCYEDDEVKALEHFKDKIVTVHIKDRGKTRHNEKDYPCICHDGIEAWTVPAGTGYIRIDEIIQKLKEWGYTGNVIAELYGYTDAYEGFKTSVKNLKKMIEK